MRLHSEEMKPFEKSCSNCYYKFEQPCTKNNHGRCLRKGKFKFWRDYYDLCIGCKRQNTQAEDYSVCCVCKHISITHSKDFYGDEIMDKEFDKTKIYTPMNITKDLIGAKGYFSDKLGSLKEYFNNERLDFVGKIVDFNENTIFIEDNDGFTNSDGWQFFYIVEMPKEKQEKWWIVPTFSPFATNELFDKFGYVYKVEVQKEFYSKSFPPLKSDFDSKEEAEKWLKEYNETFTELELNGILDFSKSNYTFEDFREEFLRMCEEFDVSFGGSFYELDRDGKRK